MEKALQVAARKMSAHWELPRWYHAVTLTERIAAKCTRTGNQPGANADELARSERKLQRWKEQAPFATGSFFAERLTMDGITESDLLALLAEPIEAVQARTASDPSAPPYWLVELTEAFTAHAPTSDAFPAMSLAEEHRFACLRPILPLLTRGGKRLGEGIHDLAEQYAFLPFDAQAIVPMLFTNLAQQVLPRFNRTFVLELNIARLQGRLQGETPEERFQSYLELLSQEDEIAALLSEYCVLARQLVVTTDLWVAFSLEFLQHLCADWEEIRALFTPEGDPGVLVKVMGGAGDTHRGGRSVMELEFASGFRLLYKPKSLAIDVHFQELLTWLNEHGAYPAFRTTRLLDRGRYGWTEFINAPECACEEEVERFYERQGGYLALLYALEATDFHAENIIASGEYPMLIDLEALFHPRSEKQNLTSFEHPGEVLGQSVLRIGLLPQRTWSNRDAAGIDISGLGGQEGQPLPLPISAWESSGTDEMRLVRKQMKTVAKKNRPRLNGRDVETVNYCDHIIAGFTAIYRLLIEHRRELISEYLPRFTADEIRFVARATRAYAILLNESFHPNKLRDALKRDRFFDRLWLAVEHQPHLSRLIPAERADLLNGDIPMFITQPSSRNLVTSRGEVIANFFAESSLELVSKRIEQLDEDDLVRQTWAIRASFTSLSTELHSIGQQSLRLQASGESVSSERLLLAARAIGDRLCDLAISKGDAACWLGVALVKEREWNLQQTDLSLYNGLPGIVLFLSYLGSVTRDSRYISLARSALKTIRYELAQLQKDLHATEIGAFDGLGSLVYLFAHLSMLWNDLSLLGEAESVVTLLSQRMAKDERFDLMAGSAGAIASLLSLYAVAPSTNILGVAIECGDKLSNAIQLSGAGDKRKAAQQPFLSPGFLCGTSGMSWSLLKLAAVSGEERFHLAAGKLMQYERVLLAEKQQAWCDSCLTDRTYSTWCSGTPGIALARLDSLEYLDDERVREEIDRALRTTIDSGFGWNHSLCHGDFGNLETLLVAAQLLENVEYQEQVEAITATLLHSIDTDGWVTGVPLAVETPGLMAGLAGTGYELLRLAYPERVPSVLLLAPPFSGA